MAGVLLGVPQLLLPSLPSSAGSWGWLCGTGGTQACLFLFCTHQEGTSLLLGPLLHLIAGQQLFLKDWGASGPCWLGEEKKTKPLWSQSNTISWRGVGGERLGSSRQCGEAKALKRIRGEGQMCFPGVKDRPWTPAGSRLHVKLPLTELSIGQGGQQESGRVSMSFPRLATAEGT